MVDPLAMAFCRRISRDLMLIVLLGCCMCSVSHGESDLMSGGTGVGIRHLLQNNKEDCPLDFLNINFTIVVEACPNENNISLADSFDAKKCCQSLCKVLGSAGDVINDQRYDCAVRFFSYLSLAGNFSQGYFATICTDPNSPQGIFCPTDANPPPPPPGGAGTFLGVDLMLVVCLMAIPMVRGWLL